MQISFLIFPRVTQLDFTGPLQFLARMPGADIAIVAKSLDLVPTDSVLKLAPTHSFETAPKADLLCIPGGHGIPDLIRDQESVDWIRQTGSAADYITSVCTGAFALGAAGFLQGKKATTHWAYTSLLPLFGATHVDERVVRDGHLFTGGGVTAGIDFALTIIRDISGREVADALQLALEYNPQPPVNCGHPSFASETLMTRMNKIYDPAVEGVRAAIEAVLREPDA